MPTLYLTNFASHNTPGAMGPGRLWTIMALPRRWEHGTGRVPVFVPDADDVRAVFAGSISMEEYRARYLRLLALRIRRGDPPMGVAPGTLVAETPLDPVLVADGDTLACACSRAMAQERRCHRAWAGAVSVLAGWDVILDGTPLDVMTARDILRARALHAPE